MTKKTKSVPTGPLPRLWSLGAPAAVVAFCCCAHPPVDELGGSWEDLPPAELRPRFGHSAAVGDGAFYIWGGLGEECLDVSSGEVTCNDGAAYDSRLRSWMPLPSLQSPTARADAPLIHSGSSLFLLGGSCGVSPTACGDSATYRIDEGVWEPIEDGDELLVRRDHVAVVAGGLIYMFGGRNAANEVISAGLTYDVATSVATPWTQEGQLSARSGHAMGVVDTMAVIWGGAAGGDRWFRDGARYDAANGVWSPMSRVGAPSPRIDAASLAIRDELLVVGGNCEGTPCQDAFAYDVGNDAWRPIQALDGLIDPAASPRLVLAEGVAWAWPLADGAVGRIDLERDRVSLSVPGPEMRVNFAMRWLPSVGLVVWGGLVVAGGEALYETSSGFLFRPQSP